MITSASYLELKSDRMPQKSVQEVLKLLSKEGKKQYPCETIVILEHSLRSAFMAEEAKSPSIEITAALLHNFGLLLSASGDERTPDQVTCPLFA